MRAARHSLWGGAMLMLAACSAAAAPPDSPVGPSTSVLTTSQTEVTSAETSDSGSDGAAPSGRCADAPRGGRLVVWETFGGEEASSVFDSFVAEFNAAQDLIRTESRRFGGGSQELLKELASTPPADWPDVVVSQPQSLRRLVDSGRVVPPGECGDIAAVMGPLLPVIESTYSFEDTLQAVPYGVSTPILLFDAAEFRAAGLDATSPPATLEELAAASQQIVDSGASPFGLVVYDWFGTFLINQGSAQRGDLVLLPANGRSRGRTKVAFDTPENLAAIQWLAKVVDEQGGVYIGGIPTGLENLLKIVDPIEGGTMTIQTSGSLGDLIEILDAGSFPGVELGVGPMPGPAPGGLVGGNGFWMIDHGDPGRLRAAFDMISWMVETPRLAGFVAATGYVPPSAKVAEEPEIQQRWEEYQQLRVGYDQLVGVEASAATGGPVYGPNVEVDYALYRMTDHVLSRRLSPEQALDELVREVQELLDQYDFVVGP
jgi:sn-glycerol 3-phosphate transport system substrate-binding protein